MKWLNSHQLSSAADMCPFPQGDGLEAAVDRFAARYGLDQEGRGNLLRHAKEAAQVQRLLPVLTTSHQLALPGGAPVTVAVAVMDGDDPGVNAVAAAFAAGVNETEAAVLARAVVEEAMRLRLLPVLRIRAEKNKDKSEVEFKVSAH